MNSLDESYWTNQYLNQSTGWDIGYAGPLANILDEITDKNARILIPGAGNAYEAEYALNQGFKNIHILDISEAPLKALESRLPKNHTITLHCQDFFDHQNTYDYVLEQTFFCALDPKLRPKYVEKMHSVLEPSGILTGVMFNFPLEIGPPFGGSISEYEALFSPKFEIEIMEEAKFSIKPRMGKELHVKFRKR